MAKSKAALSESDYCVLSGSRPEPAPEPQRAHAYRCGRHALLTTIRADGTRVYQCDTLPGFAARHDGAKTDAQVEAALDEFERLAAGGNTKTEAA